MTGPCKKKGIAGRQKNFLKNVSSEWRCCICGRLPLRIRNAF